MKITNYRPVQGANLIQGYLLNLLKPCLKIKDGLKAVDGVAQEQSVCLMLTGPTVQAPVPTASMYFICYRVLLSITL